MTLRTYLVSLPERLARSTVGVGAGLVREVAELAFPKALRRSHLYRNLVENLLRFLIEQVGGVEGVYRDEEELARDFVVRRAAGNAVEVAGVVAFRASPVWVLAALADICGIGRHLIPEIAETLKAEGILDRDAHFTSVDQILDGLERTSARLASTINMPPLDIATLRREWEALRSEVASIPPGRLPSRDTVRGVWSRLKEESARQGTSVFRMSSMLALSAAGSLPDRISLLSKSARLAARRTGQVVGAALLDHYRHTLDGIQQVGFVRYASRQLGPYLRAAIRQFSPQRRTLTDRLVEWSQKRRGIQGVGGRGSGIGKENKPTPDP